MTAVSSITKCFVNDYQRLAESDMHVCVSKS